MSLLSLQALPPCKSSDMPSLPLILLQIIERKVSRWEYNILMSTLMGIVWAGSIGTELIRELVTRQYQKVVANLLVILMTLDRIDLAGFQFQKHLK